MSSTVLGARDAVINDAFFQVAHRLIGETNMGKKYEKCYIKHIQEMHYKNRGWRVGLVIFYVYSGVSRWEYVSLPFLASRDYPYSLAHGLIPSFSKLATVSWVLVTLTSLILFPLLLSFSNESPYDDIEPTWQSGIISPCPIQLISNLHSIWYLNPSSQCNSTY